jgi:hypothetical protein
MSALSIDQTRRLRLFNEKANELDGSRFAIALYDQQSGVIVEGGLTGPAEAVFVGPDDDAIRAFVLTIRLFQQDRDRISLRALAEIYGAERVPQELRGEFDEARKALNDRLDSGTMFVLNKERITRRRLLDVFLYGGLAHVDADKRAVYEQWQAFGMAFALMSNEFVVTLGEFFNCVRWIRDINMRLLDAVS